MGCPRVSDEVIRAKLRTASFSVLDKKVRLAFIEHDSVPVYLVQNTSTLEFGRQSGVGCEHKIEVHQIAGMFRTVFSMEPARPERVRFDVSKNVSLHWTERC